jgi:hypothetical protein
MRILENASEDEMVAVFLRGELASDRWSGTLRLLLARDGRGEEVLAQPDLTDADANAYRSRILEGHRAWERRDGLFGGFPRDVEWSAPSSSRRRCSTSSSSTGIGG